MAFGFPPGYAFSLAGIPAIILLSGHILGPGWSSINAAANFNLQVFVNLACGQEVALPNLGVDQRSAAIGENLRFLPWEEWRATVSERDAQVTWAHIFCSPNCSIEKARRLLGYQPQYRSADAVKQSVFRLIEDGSLEI